MCCLNIRPTELDIIKYDLSFVYIMTSIRLPTPTYL